MSGLTKEVFGSDYGECQGVVFSWSTEREEATEFLWSIHKWLAENSKLGLTSVTAKAVKNKITFCPLWQKGKFWGNRISFSNRWRMGNKEVKLYIPKQASKENFSLLADSFLENHTSEFEEKFSRLHHEIFEFQGTRIVVSEDFPHDLSLFLRPVFTTTEWSLWDNARDGKESICQGVGGDYLAYYVTLESEFYRLDKNHITIRRPLEADVYHHTFSSSEETLKYLRRLIISLKPISARMGLTELALTINDHKVVISPVCTGNAEHEGYVYPYGYVIKIDDRETLIRETEGLQQVVKWFD